MIVGKLFISLLLLGPSALAVTAQTPDSFIKQGNKFYSRAQYELAVNEYRKVNADAGLNYSQALYNIGVCYFELWQTEEAINHYKLAMKARTNGYPKAAYALGVALESQSRWDEARVAYRQSLEGDRAGATLFRLGVLAAKENDMQTAGEFFRKALAVAGPHLASAHNNLGVMLAQRGMLIEAEQQFTLAVEQTDGAFKEAAYNLKLCRSLKTTASNNEKFMLTL
jgi:tetratricopeptide (TPR) repeat protein